MSVFQNGIAHRVLSMTVNDPAVYGENVLSLVSPSTSILGHPISGVVDVDDTLDVSMAMIVDYTTIGVSPTQVLSVQIPAAIAAPFAIGPGITGNWSDPTPGHSGHGIQFEILPNNGMLAIWFVFTPNGSGPTWIYAQGSYTPGSNTVTWPAYTSQGPKFPPNYSQSADTVSQWGTLTFTFKDCNSGTASWKPTASGYTAGSMPISRVTLPSGLTCP